MTDALYLSGPVEAADGSRRYTFVSTPGPTPEPLYVSWEDYLAHTTVSSRRAWLSRKVQSANRARLLGGRPRGRLTVAGAVQILETAHGECAVCGSLAVEPVPLDPHGRPYKLGLLERLGTIDHRIPVLAGGSNDLRNLRWVCSACNNLGASGPMHARRAASLDGPLFGLAMIPSGKRCCRRCRGPAEFRVVESTDRRWVPERGHVYCRPCFHARIPAPGGLIVELNGEETSTPPGWWEA